MAVGVPIYTGENAGVGMVREGGTKATQAIKEYGQAVLEAEKFKYGERKKEEAAFLEAIKTKPEFVISDKARQIQGDALQAYNDKWTPTIVKGYQTMEEKTRMASDKDALVALQQEQKAQYQQYLAMKEMVMKDNQNKFDKEEFKKWEDDYMQSGQFDYSTLPIMGVSPYLYLQKNPVLGTERYDAAQDMRYSGTPEEAKRHITEQAYTYEPFRVGLIKEFKNLPPATKLKYLDVDNSGTISPQEEQMAEGVSGTDNPIIRYAIDKYSDVAIRKEALKKTGTGKTAKEKEEEATPIVGGAPVKMFAGKQSPGQKKIYGDQEYSTATSFQFGGNATVYGIRTTGFKKLAGTFSAEDAASGSVNGVVRLYDPAKKVFVIEVKGSSESADVKTSALLEIPEENIMDFENIPIEFIGNKWTIGKYKEWMAGEAPPSGTTPPIKPRPY